MTDLSSLRILDACTNRACEGLRTMEEFARFVLEDQYLSKIAKQLRHDLIAAMKLIKSTDRLLARAVGSDCGTSLQTAGERHRADLMDVVTAAAGRCQESLRCIEEYGKTIVGFDSQAIEAIRYRAYTFAAALTLRQNRQERLVNARLYLLLSTDTDLTSFAIRVENLYESGVDLIQLRDKRSDDRRLYQFAKVASDIARRMGKYFIVNDRADIAAAVHASGVHLGQDELPIEAARRIVGDQLIGVSTHSIEQARSAVLDGADYIGCGPTFPSSTKSFSDFPGLPFLHEVTREITLPAYAIGGIDEQNLAAVMASGMHGVAVAAAILNSDNECDAARRLANMLLAPRTV